MTPAGVVPRLKQVTLVGTFEAGHYEYDSGLALLHIEDAQRLFQLTGPTGVQLRLQDVHSARTVAADLVVRLSSDLLVRDWTRTNRNWFDAVQIEKRLMFIILTLIVAVAAFNLVSTLVMTVTDKRADIAILRTLGASPGSIMGVFMVGCHQRHHRHAGRLFAWLGGGLQHRRHRAGAGTRPRHGFPAGQYLRHQPHAQRADGRRHRTGGGDLARSGVRGHHLPELARQPCEPG